MSTEALRKQFEDACLANFVERRASGNISDDNGSPATHEALFWRKANGDYGVTLFNAAWWGYKAGHSHRDEIGEVLALNNEQAKTIRTLRSTIDEMAKASSNPVVVMHHDDPALKRLPDGTHVILQRHVVALKPTDTSVRTHNLYRVWPDDTVQDCADGNAYNWMSDDYRHIEAETPEQALEIAKRVGL